MEIGECTQKSWKGQAILAAKRLMESKVGTYYISLQTSWFLFQIVTRKEQVMAQIPHIFSVRGTEEPEFPMLFPVTASLMLPALRRLPRPTTGDVQLGTNRGRGADSKANLENF